MHREGKGGLNKKGGVTSDKTGRGESYLRTSNARQKNSAGSGGEKSTGVRPGGGRTGIYVKGRKASGGRGQGVLSGHRGDKGGYQRGEGEKGI